jgi:ribose transport system substrate-binding protein
LNAALGTAERIKSRFGLKIGVVAVVSLMALATACSSSGKGNGGATGSAGPASAPAGSTAASGSSGGSAGLAAAKALVAKLAVRPTTLPLDGPIGKPVPKGKTVVFISCGTPNCAEEAAIIKTGTDALGWTLKSINTDGSPEQAKAAFDQVIREKDDVVLYSAIDASTFAGEAAQLKANHTFVAGCCITDTPSSANAIDYAIDVPSQTAGIGDAEAAYVANDLNGQGDSLYVNIPSLSILKTAQDAYVAGMKNYCPACKVSILGLPITSLGTTATTTIVSYLRSHSNIKYVVAATDSINVGLPAAIKAAGLSVKIGGQGADATNLQYIRAGQQQFSISFPYYEIFYSMLDAAARFEAGATVPASKALPVWILDKSNAPNETKIFPVVTDVEQQFQKQWGVGS